MSLRVMEGFRPPLVTMATRATRKTRPKTSRAEQHHHLEKVIKLANEDAPNWQPIIKVMEVGRWLTLERVKLFWLGSADTNAMWRAGDRRSTAADEEEDKGDDGSWAVTSATIK